MTHQILLSLATAAAVWLSCFISLLAAGESFRNAALYAVLVPASVLGGYVLVVLTLSL